MRNHFRQRLLILTLCFTLSVAAFGGLWALRSWNLWNGDGEFCCKQTIGKSAFAITLSRCPLTHLGYRYLFQAMNPLTGWWVEDIIAVSSCTAGLVFFWAAVLLARGLFSARLDRILYVAFCSSSLLLQVFCGHIEFYPWACALVMVLAWLAFWHLDGRLSIFWPSAALALATAFHSSAVFYFPGIVALEFVRQSRDPRHARRARWHSLFCLVLFVCLAPFHRYQTQYALFLIFCLVAWFVWGLAPRRVHVWREGFQSWLVALAPWVVYFSIRTALGFYAEPILHHIAPMGEPYDHGSFLYTFWSWEHLHDKLLFQWWLSPFAIPVSVLIAVTVKRAWPRDARLFFLGVFALSALGWEILFYPQLRIRDWDLFASTAIPLNLLVGYGVLRLWNRGRLYLALMVVAQLLISVPIILDNSDLLAGRGYASVEFRSEPVAGEVYLRGLSVGRTPLVMENIRSGRARVHIIPVDRNYRSARRRHVFRAGEQVSFNEVFRYDPRPIPGRTNSESR